ncbi:MAG TPA: Glu/Leu/Phe/Val dehydrogenase [Candidatus Binataceae bacterium]|jgi:glutamate dehydrogenase (NAD(P)+)|nr:Glu/Leu/Phe/Val dehydrogenase [Candidatus Binataceae bacterium]
MDGLFQFADDLGPEKVIGIHEPRLGLRAILVIDNTAAGPAAGGCRMAPDVTLEECARLARAMTLKNAAAGLAHGGAKSVIVGDPKMPAERKETIVRAMAHAIRDVRDYIMGPDMGLDERAMAWVHDEIGRAVGLPRELGGIPLDEIGATGFGLAIAAEVAQDFCDVRLAGARVAIQGFGAVGKHAARFLAERGATLVAACDTAGTIANDKGLDVRALTALKEQGRSVTDYPHGTRKEREAIVAIDCDIWIPAARPDAITTANVDSLRAKLVLQGANIPASAEAEARMHKRAILSVPDFIANAGGVICAAVEYKGGTESLAFDIIERKIRENTRAVLEAARERKVAPRQAALDLARRRVSAAMSYRRF